MDRGIVEPPVWLELCVCYDAFDANSVLRAWRWLDKEAGHQFLDVLEDTGELGHKQHVRIKGTRVKPLDREHVCALNEPTLIHRKLEKSFCVGLVAVAIGG